MNRNYLLLATLIVCLLMASTARPQQLKVSENLHYLVYDDGRPFFWLGDTAWELFHRLDRNETKMYLKNRAAKGFTVIQAVILAELDGLNTANAHGDRPLVNNNPSQPNERYFKHVDFVVKEADKLGLFIGMLPTWGDKVSKKWGTGPEIFNPENAYEYGKFLGERYKNYPIIWILGGDRNPEGDKQIAIWDALAQGITEGCESKQLITYHPQGGANSSTWFHHKNWLALNTFQSGHGKRDIANYKMVRHNYGLVPKKPTLDAEPCYEDHPVGWKPDKLGWFDAFDSRRAGYWSMLSGACGHTYGNHNIWQMWAPGRNPVSFARTSWPTALDHPGAFQAGYMRRFFESFPWQKLCPDQSLIINENPEGPAYQVAAISSEKDFMLIYTPYGKPIEVRLQMLSGKKLIAYWFNPRDGKYLRAGRMENTRSSVKFNPQATGRGSDWVLVLMNETADYIAGLLQKSL